MTRCPYCHRIANPSRLFLYSSMMGYRCPKCGGRSRLPRWGWIPMVAVILLAVSLGDYVLQNRVLWVLVGAVAALLVMWLLLSLHAAEGGEPQSPGV